MESQELMEEVKKVKTLMFDIPYSTGKALRRINNQYDIFTKCMAFSTTEKERKQWADLLVELEETRNETSLTIAAQVLSVPLEEVGKYICGMPFLDPNGQKIYLVVWDGSGQPLSPQPNIH